MLFYRASGQAIPCLSKLDLRQRLKLQEFKSGQQNSVILTAVKLFAAGFWFHSH